MRGDPEDPGGRRSAPVSSIGHDVQIADEQSVRVDLGALERLARRAMMSLEIPAGAALSIALVEPDAIADLKGRYYGEHGETDVLSFSMDGPAGPELGDVVICPVVAGRHARALGRALDDEMAQLLVHGLLHLVGDDHATPADEQAMYARERLLLAAARSPR